MQSGVSPAATLDGEPLPAGPAAWRSSGTLGGKPAAATSRVSARGHFVLNASSNIIYVALTALAMLFYVPFLVKHVGVAALGLMSLSQMLVLYGATVMDGLNTAVNRYLGIELQRGDDAAANRTFNSALFASGMLALLMLPVVAGVTYYLPAIFQVPTGLEVQAQILFACVALHFLMTIIESTFAAPVLIFHRFDLRNILRLAVMASRIGTVIVCFALLPASLWQVGLGFVVSGFLSLAGSWWLWRALAPNLHIARAAIDRSRSKELIHFGGWSVLNRIGVVLFVTTDLIIINWNFGPTAAGYYAVLLLFPEMIKNLMESITSILNPAIVALYARNKLHDLAKLTERAMRVFAIGLALPIGMLCGFSQPVLNLWLGPQFVHLDLLLVIMLAPLTVNLTTMPLSYVLTSYAKVRIQGGVTLGLSLVNFGAAFAVARWTNLGTEGVVACSAAALTLRNLLFLPTYTATVMGLPRWRFYAPLIPGPVAMVLIALASLALSSVMPPTSWHALIRNGLLVGLLAAPLLYVFGLNRGDRLFLRRLLPLRLRQRMVTLTLPNRLRLAGSLR